MRSLNKRLLAGFLVLLACAQAKADPIFWSYNTNNFTLQSGNGNTIMPDDPSGGGGITLSSPGFTTPVPQHDSVKNLALTNLNLVAMGDPTQITNTAQFTNASYVLNLTINYNGQSQTFAFTGQFNDSYDNLGSNITHSFTGPLEHWFIFDTASFDVRIGDLDPFGSYTGPQSPSSGAGGINAWVQAFGGTGNFQQAPEPSTMLLSCLGLSLLGAASWRKRRQLLAAAV